MSILIKGMKMPKTCDDCTISCDHDAHIDGYRMVKPSRFCPLIELPAQHGRLIDADMLKGTIWDFKWYIASDDPADMKTAFEFIDDAPTIIPAEEVDA